MPINADQGRELLDAIAQAIAETPGWIVTDRGERYVQAIPQPLKGVLPPIGIGADARAWLSLEFWIQDGRESLGAFWWSNPVGDLELRNRLLAAVIDASVNTGLHYNGQGNWRTQRESPFSGKRVSEGWWPRDGTPNLQMAQRQVQTVLSDWTGRVPAIIAAVQSVGGAPPIVPRLSNQLRRGEVYTREQIQRLLGLEPASGGNWYTGYHEHEGEWFLFPSVGIPGRTGHDYGNRWEGTSLRWYGKTDTHLNQPAMKRLLAPDAVVHLFSRESDRSPFTYQGRVTPAEVHDVSPVEVLWQLPVEPWDPFDGALPDELPETQTFREGAVKQVCANAYERNPAARKACLDHWGTECSVCELEMGARYGPIAIGFVHVHHIRSLAEIGEEYDVNPHEDLRPVCPNCHAVIHLRKPALSIDEARALLRPAN